MIKTKEDTTTLLQQVRKGSKKAYEQLFPLVYNELKGLAFSELQKERDDITFSETELVHEVYLKMIDQSRIKAKDKNHFLAIVARSMRQILVDHARKKKTEKRGGSQKDVTYIDELMKMHHEAEELISLDEKLTKLKKLNERMAQVVTLRFFGRMTLHDTADALEVSERTVKRDWAKARGWLYNELGY